MPELSWTAITLYPHELALSSGNSVFEGLLRGFVCRYTEWPPMAGMIDLPPESMKNGSCSRVPYVFTSLAGPGMTNRGAQ